MAVDAIPTPEVLNLSDGTTAVVSKPPSMVAEEWRETKKYLEENPEEGRRWETFSKDSKAVKISLQQSALDEYYNTKLNSGDEAVSNKLLGLNTNPEFAHIFEDVKRGGTQAAMQHSYNEPLMIKVSRAVGGIPEEVKDRMVQIQSNPLTLQEACKMGNIKSVEDYLKASEVSGKQNLEATDAKGVTCLGYAIGANRVAIVKLLLEKKADATKCDMSGSNGAHYAAAYGRKELLTCLLDGKVDPNAKNTQGQTPLALATKNKQKDAIEILKAKGATL
eukprot:CAMPEP_0171069728 /NCGR_PEP_ID=MMETSP0766_2-20121228/9330_1 /TAXON_ID=439317 /ORGANISM="Gambierdiscus australes, Strain CAWD 149" /LENGTH=276 /DNA_ID=CAMNT_0011526143 /DNA_START=65 /DNA_END=895 /DNA_ORIENTATION=-